MQFFTSSFHDIEPDMVEEFLHFTITMGWTRGTAGYEKEVDKYYIAYNVAVPVNVHVVIEEELHASGVKVHGLHKVDKIRKQIEAKDPFLIRDIEDSLNRILSTEENRFRELGNSLQREFSSELNLMSDFISKFENTLIESFKLP